MNKVPYNNIEFKLCIFIFIKDESLLMSNSIGDIEF